MSSRGTCVEQQRNGSDHTLIFKDPKGCYHCVKAYPRTLNIFEKIESPCVHLDKNEEPTFEKVCKGIRSDQQLITLFNENYVPINCRSSLEGVWQFAYQVRTSINLVFHLTHQIVDNL